MQSAGRYPVCIIELEFMLRALLVVIWLEGDIKLR